MVYQKRRNGTRCLDARSVNGIYFVADVFKRGIVITSRSTRFAHAHRLPPRCPIRAKPDSEFVWSFFGGGIVLSAVDKGRSNG